MRTVSVPGSRCNEVQTDLTFVLDTSAASSQSFQTMRQFLVDIVDNLQISSVNVRVGLVTIADVATNRFYLDSYNSRSQVRETRNEKPTLSAEAA